MEPQQVALLAQVNQKIDNLTELMSQHIKDDKDLQHRLIAILDGNGTPGLRTRVEVVELRLDQQDQREAKRSTNIYALWTTVLAAIIGVAGTFLSGK